MRNSPLAGSPTGTLAPTINGQWAFVPHDLPPALDLNDVASDLSAASLVLGELNGIGRTLANPYLLIAPLQAKEALTSSSMEGTFTTAGELLLLEAGLDQPSTTAEAREVRNYAVALRRAIDSLADLPLCLRTIRDAHATLLGGLGRARGGRVSHGDFRDQQNWIGSRSIESARYVPPPPPQAREKMYALETYLRREASPYPPLIDAALAHYQFEAIHPFPDGNGRVGRIVILVMLFERGAMRQPLLYLSPYLERHKDEYIQRMYEVSRVGDWSGWLRFFLRVVRETCIDTIATADRLLALQSRYRSMLSGAGRSSLPLAIVDQLFQHPVVSIPQIQARLGTSYMSAQKNLRVVEDAGIVAPVEGTSHPRFFMAKDILAVISDTAE